MGDSATMVERPISSNSAEFAFLTQIFASIEGKMATSLDVEPSTVPSTLPVRPRRGKRFPTVNVPPRFEAVAVLLPNYEALSELAADPIACRTQFGQYLLLYWTLSQKLGDALLPHRLSILQWATLHVIAANDGLSAKAIGQTLNRTQNDVRSVCYILKRDGWIVEDASQTPIVYSATDMAARVVPLPMGLSEAMLTFMRQAATAR